MHIELINLELYLVDHPWEVLGTNEQIASQVILSLVFNIINFLSDLAVKLLEWGLWFLELQISELFLLIQFLEPLIQLQYDEIFLKLGRSVLLLCGALWWISLAILGIIHTLSIQLAPWLLNCGRGLALLVLVIRVRVLIIHLALFWVLFWSPDINLIECTLQQGPFFLLELLANGAVLIQWLIHFLLCITCIYFIRSVSVFVEFLRQVAIVKLFRLLARATLLSLLNRPSCARLCWWRIQLLGSSQHGWAQWLLRLHQSICLFKDAELSNVLRVCNFCESVDALSLLWLLSLLPDLHSF